MLQIRPVIRNTSRPFAATTDTITRFLAKEERLQRVVDELGHRMRNLLAVVQAIASQTAQRSNDLKSFQSEFPQRLGALSRSMDLLVQQGERGVSVAELIQRQLEPFGDIDGKCIAATGPDVLLNQEATQNIGLALHELATNATKHGALSVPHGTITVHWELGPGEFGPACFRLTWREQCGPPVSPPTHHGFGSIVLQHMAGSALHGAVKHEFGAEGVRWTLEVPEAAIRMSVDAGRVGAEGLRAPQRFERQSRAEPGT